MDLATFRDFELTVENRFLLFEVGFGLILLFLLPPLLPGFLKPLLLSVSGTGAGDGCGKSGSIELNSG